MQTGLSWLPFGIGIVVGAGVTTQLIANRSPRLLGTVGMLISGAAVFWLSRIGHSSSYTTHIMPGIFGVAFGFGMGVVSLTFSAVQGVKAQEAGIASALLNASQQVGVAFGLAILSSIAMSTTNGLMPDALQKHARAVQRKTPCCCRTRATRSSAAMGLHCLQGLWPL